VAGLVADTTLASAPGRTPAQAPGRTPAKAPGRTPAKAPGRIPVPRWSGMVVTSREDGLEPLGLEPEPRC